MFFVCWPAATLQVYKAEFWMMLHGGPSAKRTWLWSNMPEIVTLDLGPLRKEVREQNTTAHTVRKYHDSKGRPRFVGTKALSESQKLGSYLYLC